MKTGWNNQGLVGFGIIMVFLLAGEFLSRWLNLVLPGNLTALVLLFLALVMGIIKLEQVERAATWLLNNLMLFFIPLNASLVLQWDVLKKEGLVMLASLFISTLLVMAVTAKTVEIFGKKGEQHVERVD
ncbi:MAG: CidA/LrgA family protein [Clostridia bacterium]|nr:CidA/LrgA family protein [Clostridia bacterium]